MARPAFFFLAVYIAALPAGVAAPSLLAAGTASAKEVTGGWRGLLTGEGGSGTGEGEGVARRTFGAAFFLAAGFFARTDFFMTFLAAAFLAGRFFLAADFLAATFFFAATFFLAFFLAMGNSWKR